MKNDEYIPLDCGCHTVSILAPSYDGERHSLSCPSVDPSQDVHHRLIAKDGRWVVTETIRPEVAE